MDRLAQETQIKFPNARVAFCKIPPQVHTPEDIGEKISEINEKIKSLDADFIDVKATDASLFTRDGKFYNKRGLAVLAGTIKRWAKENGHISPPLRQGTKRKTDEGSKQTIGHAEIRTSSQPIHNSNYCIYSWLRFNAVNEHSHESEHHSVVSLNL